LLKRRNARLAGLEFQNQAQAFIYQALQARRQRAGVLGQKTTVEGEKLRDIHDRVAGEARRARGQKEITGRIGKFQIAGDRGHDCRLNAAAVERVCLDHQHRPPVSRLGAARFGEIGPPDLSPLNLVHLYQESFSMDFSWARCNAASTFAGSYIFNSSTLFTGAGLINLTGGTIALNGNITSSNLQINGATVIGARQPLIAFNMYLTTNDVSVAQKIAKAVRNSSGGLRYVKAMGVLVEGRAQVSMNLTHYRQTPIGRVVETVRREAERYGVAVHHSELVGLVPQEALVDAAVWYTQLDQFEPAQILESRLYEVLRTPQTADLAASDFLADLASANPAPGGGSAAAHTAAAAAALVAMVGRVTTGKKKYAAVEAQMWPMIEEADQLRAQLTAIVEEDSAAFNGFIAATKLPKDTPEQVKARKAAMESATLAAAKVPYKTVELSTRVMQLAAQAAEIGNLNAISDACSAVHLAQAAIQSAGLNILVNVKNLKDPNPAAELVSGLHEHEHLAANLEQKVKEIVETRAEIKLG